MNKAEARRVSLLGMCIFAGWLVCAAIALGFAGRLWWVCDLCSHFRVQYLFALALVLLVAFVGRRFRTAGVLGLFAAINLACIVPYYVPAASSLPGTSRALRLISVNVHTANRQFDRVKQLIRTHDPDVVLLIEVNDQWMDALDELRAQYPHWQAAPREDNFGMALCSKRPLAPCETVYLGQADLPSIVAGIDVAGQTLTLVGTHPLPPVSATHTALRNGQLEAVAAYVASLSGPTIVMGDLNTTPWSPCFSRLLTAAKLVDSARGRGVAATWPSYAIWMGIPIDHCLVSAGISVRDKQVGPDVGSDHFPLIVDLDVATP